MKFNELKLNSTGILIAVTLVLGGVFALSAALTLDDPTAAYGVIYSSIFLAIAWRYPAIALGITLAASPFQEDLSGGFGPFRFSLGEINLCLTTIVFAYRHIAQQIPIKFGPTTIPVFIYLSICLSSSLADWRPETVVPSMLQMVLYFVVATVVYSQFAEREEQLLLSLKMYMLVCIFLSIAGLATGSFYVFGLHKNGAGQSLGCGLVVAMELWMASVKSKQKIWYFLAVMIITAGLIFSLSRGAWIGAMSGLIVVIVFRGKFKFLLQLCLVMLPMTLVFWSLLPSEDKEYALDFSESRTNISARYESIEFAKQQFEANPVYGVGVGLRKEYDATNVLWVTLAETGAPGLVAFLLVHLVFMLMVYKTQKTISRRDPIYPLLAIGVGNIANIFIHGIVDHYWSRGPLLLVWAGAGMATAVYFRERQRIANEIIAHSRGEAEVARLAAVRALAARRAR